MKISRKSLSYTIMTTPWLGGLPEYKLSRNLCGYFWQFIGTLIWIVAKYTLAAWVYWLIPKIILSVIYSWVAIRSGHLYEIVFGSELMTEYSAMVFAGLIANLIALIVFAAMVIANIIFNSKNRTRRDKKPNLIVEFWRAHKEKVCPRIEFTR